MKAIPFPGHGVTTGVTYHEVAGRGVNNPVRSIQASTIVSFADEMGHDQICQTDTDGHYIILLTPGRYNVSTSYVPNENAESDRREHCERGWIEIKAGATSSWTSPCRLRMSIERPGWGSGPQPVVGAIATKNGRAQTGAALA